MEFEFAKGAAGFSNLMTFLHEPMGNSPALSPQRYAQVMHMDIKVLAENAGVHRNSIRKSPDMDAVQDYLRQSIRVIRAALDVNDDMAQCLLWFRNEPLPPFNYKTAEMLVNGGRADDVIRYVSSLGAGAAG